MHQLSPRLRDSHRQYVDHMFWQHKLEQLRDEEARFGKRTYN